jgi:putative endonuclease
MFYVYILYSPSSDKYYVGHTDDMERRLHEHNNPEKEGTFTSKHRPWRSEAVFQCSPDRSDAMKAERFIKKQKSRRFIERLVRGESLEGSLAQLVRVPQE